MLRSSFAIYLISLIGLICGVQAQSGAWGQCGGQGWTGATTCITGYTCTVSNPYYSQCLPGASGSSSGSGQTTVKPTTTVPSTTPSSTISGPTPTGSQIRADQDPVYHFYLQNSGGVPVLGPEASSGYFTISNTITLNQPGGSQLFLNLNASSTASYQALSFGTTAITTDWGLEGDTIITTAPRQLNFLACATSDPTIYNLLLQTGNDTPPGQTCTLVTIHLPCLC